MHIWNIYLCPRLLQRFEISFRTGSGALSHWFLQEIGTVHQQ
jgi:hypothetical protein